MARCSNERREAGRERDSYAGEGGGEKTDTHTTASPGAGNGNEAMLLDASGRWCSWRSLHVEF